MTDTEREIRFDPRDKPGVTNLLTIHSALTGPSSRARKRFAGKGYGDLKGDLADVVAVPSRRRERALVEGRPAELDGCSPLAPRRPVRWPRATLAPVPDRMGFLPPHR